jgi:hypothetical protein
MEKGYTDNTMSTTSFSVVLFGYPSPPPQQAVPATQREGRLRPDSRHVLEGSWVLNRKSSLDYLYVYKDVPPSLTNRVLCFGIL